MIWFVVAIGLVARAANRRQHKQILSYLMQSHEVESDHANASTLTAISIYSMKQNEETNPSDTRRNELSRPNQQLVQ